ncbi:tRNA pseudouridine synthase A [Pelotomaculum propionicicum]|uniref:tRNA pseudouridine synthase A n=2 Tax=Pelotomaculum propionicicum TaxID=258475 RepID=A0A4Y7RRT1_9FIRM|nr:tRNA pseudouridine(38-40) synthase TruA [Pelotomaculum propionicicum]TEB11705.1 tRNA pseudouridine synthase A [Pelotomaculum propionicicum]
MANIKVTIAYDGTNYHGFQEQRGTAFQTVQGVLEERLSRLAQREIRIIGAGRTDAGVHARGQVINFDTGGWPIPTPKIVYALNSLLPRDIAALEAEEVPDSFHSRFSAVAKTYRYVINNGKRHSPFLRLYSYHIPCLLDVEAMRAGARRLLGTNDFSAFRALGTPVKTTVRTVREIQVSREDELIYIDIQADGFLYHMARMISGTLIRVGQGKLSPEEVAGILASRNSLKGGPTAPARGLYLERIEYPG